MSDVAVIDDPTVASVALDPTRGRLLGRLTEAPASAAGLAAGLDLPRQKVHYHLKALAEQGLAVEVDQRQHGGLTERFYTASAASYVVSPAALGPAGADPRRVRDRLSASYLLALAARALRDVGHLARAAAAASKRLPTLSIDTDIRFRSAAERAAFADELTATVQALASRYHDESAPDGRWYRLVTLAHPRPDSQEQAQP